MPPRVVVAGASALVMTSALDISESTKLPIQLVQRSPLLLQRGVSVDLHRDPVIAVRKQQGTSTRRAMDLAVSCLPTDESTRDDDMPSVFLHHGHLTRWRGNVLALLGDDNAVSNLYDALNIVDPSFIRAQAGLRCDLAQAHLVRDEHDQAAEHLRAARLLAKRTGSVRHQRRIELLTQQP